MSFSLRFDTLARYLIPASLFYLALPYLIFFVGWLKWYLALVCVGLVVFPLLYCIRGMGQIVAAGQEQISGSLLNLRHVALLFLISLLFLGISGVGGYGYQDTDWLKHNAILKDLIERPWPVAYRLEGQAAPLVYYIAYYLPAALLGKFGGWLLANQVLFAWSWIGLVLAMLWFIVLSRRATFTIVLLFVVFSGLDVLGQMITRSIVAPIRPEVGTLLTWDHIEQWSIGWQYSSNATLLFWAPQQSLAGWIASGFLLYTILYSPSRKYSLFYFSLTALWSPFVTIGLLPYLLAEFLLKNGPWLTRLRRYITWPNLSGLGLLLVTGLYYSAKLYPVSPSLSSDIPHGFSLSFAPDTQAKIIGLALIVVFCLLEFGLYSVFIWRARQNWNAKMRVLFATTLISLSLIPFYRYGGVNDFVMRASIPALFVLAVFLGRALYSQTLSHHLRVILIVLIALGSATALIEFRRHITGIYNAGTILQTRAPSQVMSVDQWGLSTEKQGTIVLQYVGSAQSPFFELMAQER